MYIVELRKLNIEAIDSRVLMSDKPQLIIQNNGGNEHEKSGYFGNRSCTTYCEPYMCQKMGAIFYGYG